MTPPVVTATATTAARVRPLAPLLAPLCVASLCIASLCAAPTAGAWAATLEVLVGNVRNDRGHVRVAVCPQALFLSDKCTVVGAAKARPGEVLVTISNVPPGTYAAQSFHDENDNDDLDRTLLGLPKEGIGFSNDAPFRFGPPSFGDAAFQLLPSGGRIRFNLRHYYD